MFWKNNLRHIQAQAPQITRSQTDPENSEAIEIILRNNNI